MNRYFAIFHGLVPSAPWGVAVERVNGFPKVEILMLCRTEQDANTAANLTAVGQSVTAFRGERTQPSEGGK